MSEEENKSFEEKLEELESLTEKIKDENTGIEEAIKLYQRASEISKSLTKSLKEIERKIEEVTSDDEDEFETGDFNEQTSLEDNDEIPF